MFKTICVDLVAFFTIVSLAFVSSDAQAQRYSVGDTVQTTVTTELRMQPEAFAEKGAQVPKGVELEVEDVRDGGDFVKVTYDRYTGWLNWAAVRDMAKVRAERRKIERAQQQRAERRAREAAKRAGLRQQGFGIMLSRLSRGINSADGITVYVSGENIEKEKTIKYITFTFQLFNAVGDPTSGRIRTPSKTETRGVGPIEPSDTFRYSFDNLWYSSSGDCVELHRILVEHVDGSTFTYVNDLEPVSQYSQQPINLRGDCSEF